MVQGDAEFASIVMLNLVQHLMITDYVQEESRNLFAYHLIGPNCQYLALISLPISLHKSQRSIQKRTRKMTVPVIGGTRHSRVIKLPIPLQEILVEWFVKIDETYYLMKSKKKYYSP
jgi:hypothetical protein